MDKTTKGFIIAACSVIIATPVAWLGLQVFQQAQINAARQAAEKAEAAAIAEKKRRDDRDNPVGIGRKPTGRSLCSTMTTGFGNPNG